MHLAANTRHAMHDAVIKAIAPEKSNDTSLKSWAVEVLDELNEKVDVEGPRPNSLTCPSRPPDDDLPPNQQISHYAAIFVRKSTLSAEWRFRDRALDIPASERDQWSEADSAVVTADYTPPHIVGPHAGGVYLHTADDGSVMAIAPQAATK